MWSHERDEKSSDEHPWSDARNWKSGDGDGNSDDGNSDDGDGKSGDGDGKSGDWDSKPGDWDSKPGENCGKLDNQTLIQHSNDTSHKNG